MRYVPPDVAFVAVLAPNARTGTAEPDDAAAFERWGYRETAWHNLCRAAPSQCRAVVTVPNPKLEVPPRGRHN